MSYKALIRQCVGVIGIFFCLFFSAAPSTQAAYTCQLEVRTSSGSQTEFTTEQIYLEPTENLIVRATNITENGLPVTSPDNTAFYLNPSDNWVRTYLPASQIVNGTMAEFTLPPSFFARGGKNRLRLVRDSGPTSNHEIVCNTPNYIYSGGCSSGWVSVANAGNPSSNRISETDQVRATFNPQRTLGFVGIFDYGYVNTSTGAYTTLDPNMNTGVGNFEGRLYRSTSGNVDTFGPLAPGNYKITVGAALDDISVCEMSFNVCATSDETCVTKQSATLGNPETTAETVDEFNFCAQLPAGEQRDSCNACIQGDNDPLRPKAMYTALGCIKVDNQGLVRQVIQILLSIAGLVALLSILAGAFIFTTSQGDSNKVKQAKELITAAISGILFIVFSTIILDFIGVQILRLPGLS